MAFIRKIDQSNDIPQMYDKKILYPKKIQYALSKEKKKL